MAVSKKKQNSSLIIITVAAAVLAVAAVIFLIITVAGSSSGSGGSDAEDTFIPSEELISETEQAAYALLPENYKIYQYFTEGMSVLEEPYGNKPEDGYYTCSNDSFETFDDFCDYVRSVYIEKTASKLLTDPFGSGPVYANDNGALGLSADFEPSEEEGLSWANVEFVCTPVSETQCLIQLTLKDSDGNDVVKEVNMLLEDGQWKLEEMVG